MKTKTIMLFLLAVVIAFTTACSGSGESASETATENLESSAQLLSPHKQQVRELLLSRVNGDTTFFSVRRSRTSCRARYANKLYQ